MGTQHSLSIHTTLPLFYRREQKIYLKVPGFLRSPLPLPRLLRNPGNPKRSRVSALAPLVNVSHCGKVRWGALVAYPVGEGCPFLLHGPRPRHNPPHLPDRHHRLLVGWCAMMWRSLPPVAWRRVASVQITGWRRPGSHSDQERRRSYTTASHTADKAPETPPRADPTHPVSQGWPHSEEYAAPHV